MSDTRLLQQGTIIEDMDGDVGVAISYANRRLRVYNIFYCEHGICEIYHREIVRVHAQEGENHSES